MIAERPFLLDTNILLLLIRGGPLGRYVDVTFRLRQQLNRQLACVVSHGEIWTLAERNSWGEGKRAALRAMLDNVVTIDISSEDVISAYVALASAAKRNPKGSQANLGENDLWIAAAARASEATLVTTDRHFDQFHPQLIQRAFVAQDSRLVADSPGPS